MKNILFFKIYYYMWDRSNEPNKHDDPNRSNGLDDPNSLNNPNGPDDPDGLDNQDKPDNTNGPDDMDGPDDPNEPDDSDEPDEPIKISNGALYNTRNTPQCNVIQTVSPVQCSVSDLNCVTKNDQIKHELRK